MLRRKITLLAAFFLVIISFSCTIFNNPAKINNFVEIKTTKGDFILGLYEGTPLHRDNFLKNCRHMQYDSTLIYSVIPKGMHRIGLPINEKEENILFESFPDNGIKPELNAKLIHKTGAVGMYRINNDKNPEMLSDNSLFYIIDGVPTNEKALKTLEAMRNAPMIADYITVFLKEPGNEHFGDSLEQYKINNEKEKFQNLYLKLTDNVKPRIEADGKSLFTLNKFQIEQYTNFGGVSFYDGQYTVFGKIVTGHDILKNLSDVRPGLFNKPKKNIYILSTQILTKKEYKKHIKINK